MKKKHSLLRKIQILISNFKWRLYGEKRHLRNVIDDLKGEVLHEQALSSEKSDIISQVKTIVSDINDQNFPWSLAERGFITMEQWALLDQLSNKKQGGQKGESV